MLRDAGDMERLQLPGPSRAIPRRRFRRVLLAIAGGVLTVAAADIGLQLAVQLWNDYADHVVCPSPPKAVATPPPPVYPDPPSNDVRVRFLAVRDDAVEMDVRGERFQLAGYPPPRSPHHGPSALTTAVVSADGEQIAIAGSCRGDSGSEFLLPSCARKFVRIYQVIDGTHIRDLRVPWAVVDDERRVLAMAFDESGARLAVLVRAAWSDCSWEGAGVELVVYWVGDGTRLVREVLENNDEGGARRLTFERDEVRVVTTRPHRKDTVHVVQLEPAFFEDCM
jgi:hypothetical protein